jgi:hypothetical protein
MLAFFETLTALKSVRFPFNIKKLHNAYISGSLIDRERFYALKKNVVQPW